MTSEESLYTGSVTNIARLIEACNFPPEAFVLVERAPRLVIDNPQKRRDLLRLGCLSDGVDTGSYTSGRVFNPDFELRWEQDAVKEGEISVVYIGAVLNVPGLTKSGEHTLLPVREEKRENEHTEPQYYLFGERLDEDKLSKMALKPEHGSVYYAETRIPRLLLYPEIRKKDGKLPDRLQVVVREYRVVVTDPKTQQKHEEGRTYRFVKLIKAREEKEA